MKSPARKNKKAKKPAVSQISTAAAAARAVDRGHNAFIAAMRANDTNALMKLLAPGVIFYPPNGSPLKGPEAVRVWYQAIVDTMKTTDIAIADRMVTVTGGHAIEEGAFVWKLAPVAGGAPVEDRGNFIAIWQRQSDGKWKATRDIWNSSLPLAAATEAR